MNIGMFARLLLCVTIGTLGHQAHAQDFPSKPIRLVVPSAPGGSTDTIARILGQKLSAAVGAPVVIENRVGAGGNIGAEVVSKSAPDGYTLLMAFGAHAVNATLYPKLSYDLVKDFEPVIHLSKVHIILVAHCRWPRLGN